MCDSVGRVFLFVREKRESDSLAKDEKREGYTLTCLFAWYERNVYCLVVSSRSHLNTGSDLDPNVLVWIRGESSILACLFALDERALPSRACLDGI